MGADAFTVFYGLRYTLSDGELEAVEGRTDDRIAAALRVKLQTHFGRVTNGEPHFLLIGTRLGHFGVENQFARSVDALELQEIMRTTAAKLRDAGLPGASQLHLLLQAQY